MRHSSLKIETFSEPDPGVERRWLAKWNSWPTGHVFNHPKWFRVVRMALPDRRALVIAATVNERDLLFMSAEETDHGIQLAGAPYLDKGSILWDPEISATEWDEFVSALLNRFHDVCFQEVSPPAAWTGGPVLQQQAWNPRKRSSSNPWFFVDAPRISAKQRHELRRFTRLLAKQGSVEFALKKLSRDDLETMRTIEYGSTKTERKKAVLSDPEYDSWFRAFIEHFHDSCWIALLSLNGRTIAHYTGVCYKARLLGLHMAYLKEYARFSPGSILVFNILPYLREQGIKEFDYGRGQSVMKARFAGNNDVRQWTLYYFHKDWRGLMARGRIEMVWGLIATGRLLRTVAGPRLNSILDRFSFRR